MWRAFCNLRDASAISFWRYVFWSSVKQKKEFIKSIPLLHRFIASFNPPYISATPEVNVFDIGANDEFIVMASDGVWDELDNQMVVDIVSEVLKKGNSVEVAANTVVESCLAHAASTH